MTNQLLMRLISLEEKVKMFDHLWANVEEYQLLCNNRHLPNQLLSKEVNACIHERRIIELELENNQLKYECYTCQNMYKDLEEQFMALQHRYEEMKEQMTIGIIANSNKVQLQMNINSDVTSVEELFMFSRNGNEAELKSIIQSGVDVNVTDDTGKTPLHYAAQNGHVNICEHLLDKGANTNVGKDTITPLHLACSEGHLPIVKILISRGASLTIAGLQNKDTPLHCAAQQGHATVCKHLLDRGADVNAKNNMGATPLHKACLTGHLAIVKLFIARGASVAVDSRNKYTPLHFAAQQGHTAVCECLLDNGAGVNVQNSWGATPLLLASSYGHLPVVKLLIARGACVGLTDRYGRTALTCAQGGGFISVYEHLKK